MAESQTTNVSLVLPDVRLSYPALWKPKAFTGQGKGRNETSNERYGAQLLIKKDNKSLIQKVWDAIAECERQGGVSELADDRIPFHDGDRRAREKNQPEYEDCRYVSAHSQNAIEVRDSRKDSEGKFIRLNGSEGIIYAGCRVNAAVDFWFQSGKKGYGVDRVNCTLRGIQFYADDTPLTQAAPLDADKAFAGYEGKASDRDFTDRGDRRSGDRGSDSCETGRSEETRARTDDRSRGREDRDSGRSGRGERGSSDSRETSRSSGRRDEPSRDSRRDSIDLDNLI